MGTQSELRDLNHVKQQQLERIRHDYCWWWACWYKASLQMARAKADRASRLFWRDSTNKNIALGMIWWYCWLLTKTRKRTKWKNGRWFIYGWETANVFEKKPHFKILKGDVHLLKNCLPQHNNRNKYRTNQISETLLSENRCKRRQEQHNSLWQNPALFFERWNAKAKVWFSAEIEYGWKENSMFWYGRWKSKLINSSRAKNFMFKRRTSGLRLESQIGISRLYLNTKWYFASVITLLGAEFCIGNDRRTFCMYQEFLNNCMFACQKKCNLPSKPF